MHCCKVRDHSQLSSDNNKRADEQYQAIISSSSMSNFRSCLEIFFLRNITKIWQNHSWSSTKTIPPATTASTKLLSIAIISSTTKPKVKIHQQKIYMIRRKEGAQNYQSLNLYPRIHHHTSFAMSCYYHQVAATIRAEKCKAMNEDNEQKKNERKDVRR